MPLRSRNKNAKMTVARNLLAPFVSEKFSQRSYCHFNCAMGTWKSEMKTKNNDLVPTRAEHVLSVSALHFYKKSKRDRGKFEI